MRDDYERLLDVQEAIDHIERHAPKGREAFERDELLQTWMVLHLQILGEACANLTDEIKQRHPDVAWKDIVGMRNVLVHGYFDIDLDVVWSTVEKDLPDSEASDPTNLGRGETGEGRRGDFGLTRAAVHV